MTKTNIFFLLFVAIVVITITFVNITGNKQDKAFAESFQQYEYAISLLVKTENKNSTDIETSIKILKKLSKEQPESVAITRNLGMAYAMKEDYGSAARQYKKALELKPFLSTEPIFMLQFGEMLYFSNQKQEAKLVLEKAKTLYGQEVDEKYHSRVDELLGAI
ncbi:tetratricopeptide repeat protein [Neobacillus sp. SCS-31]|uniref:tetratricopeptide repeat protein n=1 Tax=Neobacillus oceani TaxID=3115292 RepID=UPI003905E50D